VEVLVGFFTDERDGGDDAVDVPLERKPRLRDARRPRQASEMGDRGRADAKQARSVLERLHRPALNPASDEPRGVVFLRRGWRRDVYSNSCQFGTAALSVDGSAGSPSTVSRLNKKPAIQSAPSLEPDGEAEHTN
jgi:hypothetical protein